MLVFAAAKPVHEGGRLSQKSMGDSAPSTLTGADVAHVGRMTIHVSLALLVAHLHRAQGLQVGCGNRENLLQLAALAAA